MRIQHFCNSFLSIESGYSRILCDPWIGAADNCSWMTFPYSDEGAEIINSLQPNFIYISHLHNDHFDPKTLLHIDKATPIIVKTFSDQRLKKKVADLGFEEIRELDPWVLARLNDDFNVSIVPSDSPTTEPTEVGVLYDLDTSLLIHCRNTDRLYFNKVDNPLTDASLSKVKKYAHETFSRDIDIASFAVGAASEYPQCFLNVDRQNEQDKIVQKSLEQLLRQLEVLDPKCLFVAGGTYIIRGKYWGLNRFIAQPTFARVRDHLKDWEAKGHQVLEAEGGSQILWSSDRQLWKVNETRWTKYIDINDFRTKNSKEKYDYPDQFRRQNSLTIEENHEIEQLFQRAVEKYKNKLRNIKKDIYWAVRFYLYNSISLDESQRISETSSVLKSVNIPSERGEEEQLLSLHMDTDLFIHLLRGKGNWNSALSGTYILFEREPNVFLADVPFSLNFLVAH